MSDVAAYISLGVRCFQCREVCGLAMPVHIPPCTGNNAHPKKYMLPHHS